MRTKLTVGGVGLACSALALVVTGTFAAAAPAAPPVTKSVKLTYASNGTTVLATKGERVVVVLSTRHTSWSVATVTQSTPVLTLVSEGRTSTGASRTVFRVTGYGTAGLDAVGTPICPTPGGCPQYVLGWHADVVVPVVDPPGA